MFENAHDIYSFSFIGVALVVGNQIGSGILCVFDCFLMESHLAHFALFVAVHSSSPGVVLADSGSVGASLLVWVVSGVLAWTGARHVPNIRSRTKAAHLTVMLARSQNSVLPFR
jgi:hypothetical protein